jgi:hypothetical protein
VVHGESVDDRQDTRGVAVGVEARRAGWLVDAPEWDPC